MISLYQILHFTLAFFYSILFLCIQYIILYIKSQAQMIFLLSRPQKVLRTDVILKIFCTKDG